MIGASARLGSAGGRKRSALGRAWGITIHAPASPGGELGAVLPRAGGAGGGAGGVDCAWSCDAGSLVVAGCTGHSDFGAGSLEPWIFATVARYSSSEIAVKSSADSALAVLGLGAVADAACGHCSIPVDACEVSPDGGVGGAVATDPGTGLALAASSDA